MMDEKTLEKILSKPTLYANAIGYTLLQPQIHDEWIKMLMYSKEDITLQAHRESYKTTCVIVAITLLLVFKPNSPNLLLRKDQDSVMEITRAIKRNLRNPITLEIIKFLYKKDLSFIKETSEEIHTNLCTDLGKKESQFLASGIGSFSITGKHFPRIYTDDIVTLKDRRSRAERNATKAVYQEIQNVKSAGGTIVNTGTPWHKDDCFSIMPKPKKFTVYETGLMSDKEIINRKNKMSASLFSANYELKHISDADSLFKNPKYGEYPNRDSRAQIDCSYGGEDTTALTIMTQYKGKTYAYGKVFTGHVQNNYSEIASLLSKYRSGTLYAETNADKGFFAKEFRNYWPIISSYHESTNKHVKIVTYLQKEWANITWDTRTDPKYIEQIVEYQEGVNRDDAPDSASSLIREYNRGKVKAVDTLGY